MEHNEEGMPRVLCFELPAPVTPSTKGVHLFGKGIELSRRSLVVFFF